MCTLRRPGGCFATFYMEPPPASHVEIRKFPIVPGGGMTISPAPERGRELGALPPARLDQFVGVRCGSGVGGRRIGERPEADHQRLRKRPRLRGDVFDAVDLDAGLLAGLADHRLLGRLARLDEAGEGRPPVSGRAAPAAQQTAVAGLHEHRDRGIGPGELDQAAPGATAPVAGRLHHGLVAGAPAVSRDAMPPDQRHGVRRERRLCRFKLVRQPAERDELEDPAVARGRGGRVVGEQRGPGGVQSEECQLGAGREGRGWDKRERPLGADGHLLIGSDEHRSGTVSRTQSFRDRVLAQMRGSVERAGGERDLSGSRRHRGERFQTTPRDTGGAASPTVRALRTG